MKLQVIIGSVRQGRVSDKVARWTKLEAEKLEGTEVEMIDLKDYGLPMFDEPVSPQYNPDRQPVAEARRFLDKLAEADAYAIVTPEYNRSFSSALKNALDYIDFQFAKKPVAIVSHGSTGGAQAVSHLRGVLAGLKSFSTPTATYVAGRAGELIDDSGKIEDEEIINNPYGPQGALKATLTELKWYSDALSMARAQDPQ